MLGPSGGRYRWGGDEWHNRQGAEIMWEVVCKEPATPYDDGGQCNGWTERQRASGSAAEPTGAGVYIRVQRACGRGRVL